MWPLSCLFGSPWPCTSIQIMSLIKCILLAQNQVFSHPVNPFDAIARETSITLSNIGTNLNILKSGIGSAKDAATSQVKGLAKTAQDVHSVFFTPPQDAANSAAGSRSAIRYPVKSLGDFAERRVARATSTALMNTPALRKLHPQLKPHASNFIDSKTAWLFDSLCRGKTHSNPDIRGISNEIQRRIAGGVGKNPQAVHPIIIHATINAICLSKIIPFR